MEITSTLATACDILNQRPLLLTAESTLEEKNILCPAYLTCADLDLKHTSCSSDQDTHRVFSIHNSPLTRRATMIQERIERFRDTFNTFMTKNLSSLGKFNVDFNKIEVGDVCLILDKVHQGTLPVQSKQRYTLGVVEKMLSDRSFELRYARHTERGQYKVFTCDRSIQGLALITKAHKLDEIENQDIILDPIYPVDNLLAEDVGIDERAQMDKDEPIGTEGTEIRDTDTHVSYEEGQHSQSENDSTNNENTPSPVIKSTQKKKGPIISFVKEAPRIRNLRKNKN